ELAQLDDAAAPEHVLVEIAGEVLGRAVGGWRQRRRAGNRRLRGAGGEQQGDTRQPADVHADYSFSQCRQALPPAFARRSRSSASVVCIDSANCQGGFSTSMPLPFSLSGESSARTSSSSVRIDLAGSLASRRIAG